VETDTYFEFLKINLVEEFNLSPKLKLKLDEGLGVLLTEIFWCKKTC